MFTTQEPFSTAKASLETQFAAAADLTGKTLQSVAQLVDLNVRAAKASLEQSAAAAQQLLAAKDAQEFFALSAAQTQPNAETALAYGRSVANIASATHAEFSEAAKAQLAEITRKANELVEGFGKYAPAGSESAIALWKSAINNVNAGYEQLNKNAKQAAETLEENLTKFTTQFSQTAEKTATRAKK